MAASLSILVILVVHICQLSRGDSISDGLDSFSDRLDKLEKLVRLQEEQLEEQKQVFEARFQDLESRLETQEAQCQIEKTKLHSELNAKFDSNENEKSFGNFETKTKQDDVHFDLKPTSYVRGHSTRFSVHLLAPRVSLDALPQKENHASREVHGSDVEKHVPGGKQNKRDLVEEYGRSPRADDVNALEPIVSQLSRQLTEMAAEVQVLKNANVQQDAAIKEAGHSVYVRWGSSQCPTTTQLVYSGVVGGSYYSEDAANYLCLTMSPVMSDHVINAGNGGRDSAALLYGAEYETAHSAHHNNDAVCAVCRTPRPTTIMIPGTNRCDPGWTHEYSGFLMAGWHGRDAATEFICVDSQMEGRPGTSANLDGKLLYYTLAVCGSLPCEPYVNNKVVTCAVCSK